MNWGSSITYLGETSVKNASTVFGIKDADRLQHIALVGKMGSGRANFLTQVALQDVERGIGTVLLDGVGNFVQTFLERLPKDAEERVIVLDPSDGEHPYSWNPLDDFRALAHEYAFSPLSDMLASVYQVSRGPLVEFVARYMLQAENATLLHLYELVSDPKARERLLPSAEAKSEFEALLKDAGDTATLIHENGRYLAKDSLMRNILGQPTSKFTLDVLEKGGIVIVDFSRIRMFPTRITGLVRLFVHLARLHSTENIPLALYMQDCVRYLSVEDLDKALFDRGLMLTVSDTSHGEEEKTLREKALQRSGTVIAFTPHEMDEPLVNHVFYPYVSPEEFEKLHEGEFVIALTIDSVRSKPFFGSVLPLPARSGLSHQDVQLYSRNLYTLQRVKVDEMFRPKKDDTEKGKDGEPGSFSDAFRSIFTKQAGAGKDGKATGAAPVAAAAKPEPKAVPEKKDVKGGTPVPPAEIPEDKLKKMLHVRKISKKKN